MYYDKSHIPAFADDVVNGRIDESVALALFPEDLQRILKVEIGKRLRSRGYDRENIGNTTDKGLSYLADDIVLGLVGEDKAFELLKFKVYHKPLKEEIAKRREDEILWNQALVSQTIEMFEKYLDTYNNPDSSYVGRYVSRAEENIRHIEADDKEWIEAKRLDTESAYLHYLDIYDKPAPSYRGKHLSEVKESIARLKDEADWKKASENNTLQSYSDYLSLHNQNGAHVKDAHLAISKIYDETDWSHAVHLNTVDSYKAYLDKYDAELPAYIGIHVSEAKRVIESLTPPPAPDPRIKDDEAWSKAIVKNTIEAYKGYLNEYGDASAEGYIGAHIKEAEWSIRHIIDESAWSKAKSLNTIAGYQEYKDVCDTNNYPGYNWAHYNAACTNIDNLKKAEDIRLQKEDDNTDWANALSDNTIESYKRYLSLHNAGIHKKEALDAIAKLEKQAFINQENKDWQTACKANALSAYKSFVAKYSNPSLKFKPTHLEAAKQRIAELTPTPTPIKWTKWFVVFLAIISIAAILIYQRKCHGWPFEKKTTNLPINIIEDVDSLQWAIDNHNIPLLTKYAEMDSVRAYYPLALDLNAQDSVANIEQTLHWLDLVLDPDVKSLHQNIINDIQTKELGVIEIRFSAVNPDEKDADQKYLEIYKDYISHFEQLAKHTPQVPIRRLAIIEKTASEQITDRQKHEELRTSILREWETQKSRLNTVLSQIDDNAKSAYSTSK